MSTVNENLKPKGVYHCRGGIERYVKTFPQGGFWRGKNYLFDRRMEQTPTIKDQESVENDVDSKCSLCRIKWTVYRGQYKCHRCSVPVIVCSSCTSIATSKPDRLVCELCREGYRAPSELPDLVGMKRKADEIVGSTTKDGKCGEDVKENSASQAQLDKKPKTYYKDRLFFKRVPLTVNFQKMKNIIGDDKISALHWITDKESGGFYGSCIALMKNADIKAQVLGRYVGKDGLRIGKKKIRIEEVLVKEGGVGLFKDNFIQKEYPPIGNYCK